MEESGISDQESVIRDQGTGIRDLEKG